MPKFTLSANACTFSRSEHARCLKYSPFSSLLARQTVEAKTVDELQAAMVAFSDKVGAAYKGSYFVAQILARGERAPRGYRQYGPNGPRPVEVDRDCLTVEAFCDKAQAVLGRQLGPNLNAILALLANEGGADGAALRAQWFNDSPTSEPPDVQPLNL